MYLPRSADGTGVPVSGSEVFRAIAPCAWNAKPIEARKRPFCSSQSLELSRHFQVCAIAKATDADNLARKSFRHPWILVMRKSVIPAALGLSVFLGTGAMAADATVPVKSVMDSTVSNWASGDSDWQDIFDESKLPQLYSKDFATKYRAAAQFPAEDDGISPFDYDVIVGGQDACPLQDLTISPHAPAGGKTEVVAQFKKSTCNGPDPEYQAYTSVRFEVIEEGGKPVIDDILTTDENGNVISLKDSMQEIAKQQQ
jgi:hypothetical protein